MNSQDLSRVTMKTKRLTLREFQDADLAAVHDYAQDAETTKYLEWGPNTLKETTVFLNESLGFQKEKPRVTFDMAIIADSDARLVGACSVTIIDKRKNIAALGYVLNSKFWGHGYATEAANALAKFAFEELGMQKIMATCDALNFGSESVMKKIGMQKEQKLSKDKFIKGSYRDTLVYSIERAVWMQKNSADVAQ
ncbi:MAG: GNAT family N-acetyltransferase [Cyanobacteria bacterium SZAS-4]|nr:GNAT family N-acetyltransferase [Cyanobacteria bacterium SZAS-4]